MANKLLKQSSNQDDILREDLFKANSANALSKNKWRPITIMKAIFHL